MERKILKFSAKRKNQPSYTYVGLGGVENGHMVGVWVLQTHYAQSYKIVNFHVLLGCLTKKLLCTHWTAEHLLHFILRSSDVHSQQIVQPYCTG